MKMQQNTNFLHSLLGGFICILSSSLSIQAQGTTSSSDSLYYYAEESYGPVEINGKGNEQQQISFSLYLGTDADLLNSNAESILDRMDSVHFHMKVEMTESYVKMENYAASDSAFTCDTPPYLLTIKTARTKSSEDSPSLIYPIILSDGQTDCDAGMVLTSGFIVVIGDVNPLIAGDSKLAKVSVDHLKLFYKGESIPIAPGQLEQ